MCLPLMALMALTDLKDRLDLMDRFRLPLRSAHWDRRGLYLPFHPLNR
jgi:hypothetical protein